MEQDAVTGLPAVFIKRLAAWVPSERLTAVLASFAQEKPVALRLNPLQGDSDLTRDELRQAGFELTPVPWYDLAFTLPLAQKRALTETPAFAQGRIYIQSLSSMLAALMLDPQPGEEVLDLAAAPGGKTTHLAVLMRNQGRLAAVEAIKGRFFRLQANLKQQGVQIAHTYLADGRSIGRKVPARFDRVLLDAPCSSESRFRAHQPDTFEHWTLRKIKETSRKQNGLMASAYEALKPGGRLLYATCSLSAEENEAVVDGLLRKHADLQVVPLSAPAGVSALPGLMAWDKVSYDARVAGALRILPSEQMDGFFLCLLHKGSRSAQ